MRNLIIILATGTGCKNSALIANINKNTKIYPTHNSNSYGKNLLKIFGDTYVTKEVAIIVRSPIIMLNLRYSPLFSDLKSALNTDSREVSFSENTDSSDFSFSENTEPNELSFSSKDFSYISRRASKYFSDISKRALKYFSDPSIRSLIDFSSLVKSSFVDKELSTTACLSATIIYAPLRLLSYIPTIISRICNRSIPKFTIMTHTRLMDMQGAH